MLNLANAETMGNEVIGDRAAGDLGKEQPAGWYIYEMREKMDIEVKSVWGLANEGEPGNVLVDKLAKKGAGF